MMMRDSSGMTLIEVLVTLVVLSFGLLGMAALQITGVRSANGSAYRTQATVLANDLVEILRTNPRAVNDNLFMDFDSTALDCSDLPANYCAEQYSAEDGVVESDICTPAQMAMFELNVWFCGVQVDGQRAGGVINSLPQAQASISCLDTDPPGGDADDCTDRSMHTVVLTWSEQNPELNSTGPVSKSVTLTVQP